MADVLSQAEVESEIMRISRLCEKVTTESYEGLTEDELQMLLDDEELEATEQDTRVIKATQMVSPNTSNTGARNPNNPVRGAVQT